MSGGGSVEGRNLQFAGLCSRRQNRCHLSDCTIAFRFTSYLRHSHHRFAVPLPLRGRLKFDFSFCTKGAASMPIISHTYRAAIFDLDGTLIDSLEDLADSANAMLKSYGFPTHPVDPYRYFVGNGSRKLIERCLPKEQGSDRGATPPSSTKPLRATKTSTPSIRRTRPTSTTASRTCSRSSRNATSPSASARTNTSLPQKTSSAPCSPRALLRASWATRRASRGSPTRKKS